MDGDGQVGVLQGGLDHLHEVNVLGILARALAHLQDHRRVFHFRGLGDTLDDLHVVNVERPDRIPAGVGFLEHFFRID
jgi:hypothetical protein